MTYSVGSRDVAEEGYVSCVGRLAGQVLGLG